MKLLLVTLVASLATRLQVAQAEASALTGALQDLIKTLRGADDRLFPWDVTAETSVQQDALCPKALPDALEVLLTPLPETDRNSALELQTLAATLAALCVTDKPANRAIVAAFNPLIFESVTKLVALVPELYSRTGEIIDDADYDAVDAAAAAASHLIWIASYGNAVNHAGFVPAVPALGQVIVMAHQAEHSEEFKPKLLPATVMWASAALQNLAASYCDNSAATEGEKEDPRCHWEWKLDEATHLYTLQIEATAKLVVDAAPVRQTLLDMPSLMDSLLEWTCKGPVSGEMTHWNPFPGETAVVHQPWLLQGTDVTADEHEALSFRHETSHNLVPWAAAGALKNIILNPAARTVVDEDVSCFCWLQRSDDWLEANKGEGVLAHLRPMNPCNFENEEHPEDEDEDEERIATFYLCVDTTHYLDVHHNGCDDMATPELCDSSLDVSTGVGAKTACCACGGGVIDNTSRNGLRALGLEEDEDESEDEL